MRVDTLSHSNKDILSYVRHVMGFNRTMPQEKVYLHFDNTGYFEGETIWFKAYVTRADNSRPTDLSKVLYVELLTPTGDVIQTKKYHIDEQGQAHGDLSVDSILGTGFYEVRAYTRYMTNWGTNAVFSRVFPIFEKPETEGDYSNPTIEKRLYQDRNPNNRHPNDSIYTKAVAEGIYTNHEAKTISAQFYPEGGHLVQGKNCRVAMLAVNDNGRPYQGEGFVVNPQGDVLAVVETDTLGRGVFTIVPDEQPLTLKMQNSSGKEQTFPLSLALQEGCALNLNVVDDDALATLQCSNGVCGTLIGYTLMNNGNIYFCDTTTASPLIEVELNRQQLKEGVNQLTIFNDAGQVLAERLFFICPTPCATDSIIFTSDQTSLKPCGKVSIDVQTLPNATFSFSAMDAQSITNAKQGNLKTWMLLSSEVRGYIDHVNYYFESDDRKHRQAADLLMLTQGWRRYDWHVMSGATTMENIQPVEDKFYVFGQLRAYRKRNPVSHVAMQVLLYNQQGQSLKGTTRTDEEGNYAFELPFLDGEWKMFFYTVLDSKLKTYRVGINRQISPLPRYISPTEVTFGLAPTPNFLVNPSGKAASQDYTFVPITQKNILLEAVTVKAKKRYFTNDDFFYKDESFGRERAAIYYDIDRERENILDHGEDEPTIFEFLAKKNALFNNPDGINLPQPVAPDTMSDGAAWTKWIGYMAYGHRPIRWIVDNGGTHNAGAETSEQGAEGDGFFPTTLDEIKSVYIVPYDPGTIIFQPNEEAKVTIYLYTHKRFTTSSNKGIRRTYFQGFNDVATFKTEDYSVLPPMADFRRTLYWQPDITADDKGRAQIEFFNNSTCESIYISAEGMTSEGRFIIKE